MPTPIVQFGTSRFLQAHADLFVSEALAAGKALGPVTVVQTTRSAERAGRLPALAAPGGFPVIVRGVEGGERVEKRVQVKSITRALSAQDAWPELCRIVAEEAEVLISNTGDTGYRIGEDDAEKTVPRSFPGKLLVLLKARFDAGARPLTVLPCELVSRNGETLQRLVVSLAESRIGGRSFAGFLKDGVVWGNTLVDRIVSEPLEPAGAVAEPYALWAIERQPGLVAPCEHPSIVLTDDLTPYEKLKLHILNLGHTVLADIWLKEHRPEAEFVREILAVPRIAGTLSDLYAAEVVPAFAAKGLGAEASRYVATTLERFANPFLDHRLADIANHHADKLVRRIVDFHRWSPETPMPRLLAIAGQ
ncbi:mannitol dehydrogenase family protein [Ensifer soli]|uniref:mannitol dehydrogenase family protein n=1 Tax=Ciceribacter sp. sgz301302 TaxID=3342379 RepID=UPI0035B998E2